MVYHFCLIFVLRLIFIVFFNLANQNYSSIHNAMIIVLSIILYTRALCAWNLKPGSGIHFSIVVIQDKFIQLLFTPFKQFKLQKQSNWRGKIIVFYI